MSLGVTLYTNSADNHDETVTTVHKCSFCMLKAGKRQSLKENPVLPRSDGTDLNVSTLAVVSH